MRVDEMGLDCWSVENWKDEQSKQSKAYVHIQVHTYPPFITLHRLFL